jgi:hypothetical protein
MKCKHRLSLFSRAPFYDCMFASRNQFHCTSRNCAHPSALQKRPRNSPSATADNILSPLGNASGRPIPRLSSAVLTEAGCCHDRAVGRPTGRPSPGGFRHFLFSVLSIPALGPSQPPIQWVPGGSFLGSKTVGT